MPKGQVSETQSTNSGALLAIKDLEEIKFDETKAEELTGDGFAAIEIEVAKIVAQPKPKVMAKPKTMSQAAKWAKYYKVQAGYFKNKSNAYSLAKKLKQAGFEYYLKKMNNGWRVQVGAYYKRYPAEVLQKNLKAKGFESLLVYE